MKANKILPIIFGFSLIIIAGFLVVILEPESVEMVKKEKIRQTVSVVQTQPQIYIPSIKLLGTTFAHWPVEIKSQSSAKLVWLSEQSEVGMFVKQGDILAKLDTTHLKSQLAQAHSEQKQAELNLQREQHEQTVALKMLSKNNNSKYARREPQIAFAKAELHRTIEAYQSALQHLKDATIIAPFDAIILQRSISPAQQIEAGETLFTLASSESLNIRVPVPEQIWEKINLVLESLHTQVVDRQGMDHVARLRYIAPEVDTTSRQKQLVLAVDKPYSGSSTLLPNQQVKVEILLSAHNEVVKIPLSALTRDGQVWTVNGENKLILENVTLIEENQSDAYVVFNRNTMQSRLVVSYPLLSMIVGLHVDPQTIEPTIVKVKEL